MWVSLPHEWSQAGHCSVANPPLPGVLSPQNGCVSELGLQFQAPLIRLTLFPEQRFSDVWVGGGGGEGFARAPNEPPPPLAKANNQIPTPCVNPPSTSPPGVFVMTASQALIRPSGEDAMGRSCILDSPPPPGRGMPAAVRMPAEVQMPDCHGRRFKGERPIGAATGPPRPCANPPPPT